MGEAAGIHSRSISGFAPRDAEHRPAKQPEAAFSEGRRCLRIGAPGGRHRERHAKNERLAACTQPFAGRWRTTVTGLGNATLVPSPSVAPFVGSIDPPGGYGPLSGDRDHTLAFRVRFAGIPCKPEERVATATIDVVAGKRVRITVPPCAFVYSVKLVCGVRPECGCGCAPVRPGRTATEVNVHNSSSEEVVLRKRFIPLVFMGAPGGREPRAAGSRAEDRIVLPPHAATMDDCCRISEALLGVAQSGPVPLTLGVLEIASTVELEVTAVYTAAGEAESTPSVEVTRFRAEMSPP